MRATGLIYDIRITRPPLIIYTHIKEEMLKKETIDLNGVFKKHLDKD